MDVSDAMSVIADPVVELAAGPARVVVAPSAGGRLSALRVAELDLLVGAEENGNDPLGWGCYPMAPWAGRVANGRFTFEGTTYQLERTMPPHAIHGTLWGRAWGVEDAGPDSCRLSADLAPGWPFGGRAVHTVALDASAVTFTLEIHAEDRPMPVSCGWHPWWRRDLRVGGPLELHVELGARWERDRDGIPSGALVPTGDRPALGWDDCFTELGGPPVLCWPGAVEVTIESDCEHLVVFDQPATAMCVEPQTAPPDAFNLGRAALVEPGRPLVAHTRWSWILG